MIVITNSLIVLKTYLALLALKADAKDTLAWLSVDGNSLVSLGFTLQYYQGSKVLLSRGEPKTA